LDTGCPPGTEFFIYPGYHCQGGIG
jgi:hypothetical protein